MRTRLLLNGVKNKLKMENISNYGNDKLEFRQIILSYLRKIIDLNLKLVSDNYAVDFAKTYMRSVVGLSDILIPFSDAQTHKVYAKFERDYEEIKKTTCKDGRILQIANYSARILKISRVLFRELNLLLKRNDYLKESVYGEDKDEVVSEEGDSE